MGCHFLLQGIFPTQGSNPDLLHCRQILYRLSYNKASIKKVECRKIEAFELWCWRRLLRVPWIARRSNQSILREIKPEYLLEGLMVKLKLQYFGHLMQTADLLEKSLMRGKMEGRRERGHQRMRWQDGITETMDMILGKIQEFQLHHQSFQ